MNRRGTDAARAPPPGTSAPVSTELEDPLAGDPLVASLATSHDDRRDGADSDAW